MTNNKMKMVAAPTMNINGFALLFSELKGTNLHLPMAPWFDQTLSFSIAIMIEGKSENERHIPILQLTSRKVGVAFILCIEQNRLTLIFNNGQQSTRLSAQAACDPDKWINIVVSLSEFGLNLFIDGQLQASAKIVLDTGLSAIDQGQLGWPEATSMQTSTESAQANTTSMSFQVKFLRLWRADIYYQQPANESQCDNNVSDTDALVANWRYQAQQYPSPVQAISQRDLGTSSAVPQWIFNPDNNVIEHFPLPLANTNDSASSKLPVYHLAAPQDPERQKDMEAIVAPISDEIICKNESKTQKSRWRVKVRRRYRH